MARRKGAYIGNVACGPPKVNKAVQGNLVAAALVRQHPVEAMPALLVQLSNTGLQLLQGLGSGQEGSGAV